MVTVAEIYPIILADIKSKLPAESVNKGTLTPADLVQLTGNSTDTQYKDIENDAYDLPVRPKGRLHVIDLYELAMHKTIKVVAMANGTHKADTRKPVVEDVPDTPAEKPKRGRGRPPNTIPRRLKKTQEKAHERFWAEYDSLWSLLTAQRLASETISPATIQSSKQAV